jgi:hypothetical protein
MDSRVLATTRRSLHGVAELVLAGPQHRQSGTIRLRVTDGGFSTTAAPDVRVVGSRLIAGGAGTELDGRTFRDVASAVGVEATPLADVYADGPGIVPDDRIEVDSGAATYLCRVFEVGDAALRGLAPDLEPVLWPEHFDLGISLDDANYGISPGDDGHAGPYAYVGPWTPRSGAFWNAPFGARLALDGDLDAEAIADFFREGRQHAAEP